MARAARLDRELLATALEPFKPTLWHALNILGGVARCARERFGRTEPPWSLIGLYTSGRLLGPSSPLRTRAPAADWAPARPQPSVNAPSTPSPCRARRHRSEHRVTTPTKPRIHVRNLSDDVICKMNDGHHPGQKPMVLDTQRPRRLANAQFSTHQGSKPIYLPSEPVGSAPRTACQLVARLDIRERKSQ